MRGLGHLILILSFTFAAGCGLGDREDVLLLVRAGDPTSLAIAEEYADARDIDSDRIVELALSGEQHDVEIDAETYLREIAEPLERYLEVSDPSDEISLLVTTQGIPLRIGNCDRGAPRYPFDCPSAAVDAALAQLGRTGDETRAFHRTENPFFRDPRSFEEFRSAAENAPLRFLVARLESGEQEPNEGISPALLDLIHRPAPSAPPENAPAPLWQVVAEQARGERTLPAAALLDAIADQLPRFDQRVCDGCDNEAIETPPSGVILQSDREPEWTRASLAFPGLVIRVGETAVGRASTPGARAPLHRFVAKWFELGAGAISTHLADPSLADVTRPTAQLIAFAEGSSAVEAHFKSVPQLGWVNVFFGDPLLVLPESARAEGVEGDHDRDGVPDAEDNCRDDPNKNQLDTNADGIGNLCDPDVDDDGDVDTSWGAIYPLEERGDLQAIMLTAKNGPFDPNHDLDGDGRVDERDLVRAQLWLNRAPGKPGPRTDRTLAAARRPKP